MLELLGPAQRGQAFAFFASLVFKSLNKEKKAARNRLCDPNGVEHHSQG
jgi:hypothetical protein